MGSVFMAKRNKISYETKLSAVNEYLNGKGSYEVISQKYGLGCSNLKFFVKKYLAGGPESLSHNTKNQNYSSDFKLRVVEEYLQGGISYKDLAVKHGIKSDSQVFNWIKLYNGGKNLKSYKTGGESTMNKGRKTTYEERVEIVEDCLRNSLNYNATAAKYNVTYQQIYSWVGKYKDRGAAGLKDNRGKGKDVEDMNEVERLTAENRLLKAQLERMRIEEELKKKVQELRMGLDTTKRKKK